MNKAASLMENVFSIYYVKLLRLYLWPLGWPAEIFGDKISLLVRIHRASLPTHSVIVVLVQINYLIQMKNMIDLFHTGHVFLTTILTWLTLLSIPFKAFTALICVLIKCFTLVRVCLPSFKTYNVLAKKFFLKFHLIHFKHFGKHFEEIYITTNKISSIFTHCMITLTVLGIIGFNITSMYNNYKAGVFTNKRNPNATYEFSIYYKYPWLDSEEYFTMFTIYNYYLTFNCATTICSMDSYLILMMFQVIGHLYALKTSIINMSSFHEELLSEKKENNHISQSFCKMFNEEENKKIHLKLKGVIDHHRFIVSFADDISSFFGPVLAINYLCHLVVCCLSLLEISQGDPKAMAKYGPLTIMVFGQLILISVIFEIVDTVSEKLNDDLYCVPWESMNMSNRRTLCILLQRLQKPISITAMDITTVGVQTMAKILKTTFSYFTFLRSMDS